MSEKICGIMQSLFKILNLIKGYDVALSDPCKGKMIARFNGTSFIITVRPLYPNGQDEPSFDEVVDKNSYILK